MPTKLTFHLNQSPFVIFDENNIPYKYMYTFAKVKSSVCQWNLSIETTRNDDEMLLVAVLMMVIIVELDKQKV